MATLSEGCKPDNFELYNPKAQFYNYLRHVFKSC